MTPAQKRTDHVTTLVEQDLTALAQILHALGPAYVGEFQAELMAKAATAEKIVVADVAAGKPIDPVAQRDYLTYRLAFLGVGQIHLVLAEVIRLKRESN
jgi:hypothetical protein